MLLLLLVLAVCAFTSFGLVLCCPVDDFKVFPTGKVGLKTCRRRLTTKNDDDDDENDKVEGVQIYQIQRFTIHVCVEQVSARETTSKTTFVIAKETLLLNVFNEQMESLFKVSVVKYTRNLNLP